MKFASGKIAANISICAFGIYLVHNPINMIMVVTPAEMPAWCLSTMKIGKNVLICLTGRNLYLMYGNDIMKRRDK